ncbi:MAG: BamA/TamA family outer membrane protein [Bacteroidota bacterium]
MARVIIIMMVGFLLGFTQASHAQEPLVIAQDRLVIEDILIQGNQVTKDPIILRELVFGIGDTILKMELLPAFQRSKENLLNLTLFNFVYFDATHLPGNRINVQITVTERWYIWPIPILEYAERNFSEFVKNREWDKINYGFFLKWKNFRGRNEMLTTKIRLGYSQVYSLDYTVPNIGKRQQHGVSSGFNMHQQNEVIIATVSNQPVEYKPWEKPAEIRLNAYTRYTFRRKLYTAHTLRFEYFDYIVSDSVAIYNPNFLGEGRTQLQFFALSYIFNHDVRDSKVYPLEGFAVKIRADQLGMGIIPDYPYATLRITGNLMFHQKLANRIYFYNTTKGRYSSEKFMPYALNRGLGYNEFLSGYESYVMDGSDYVISKYNLKFQVIKPTTQSIPFIGMEQFKKVHYAIYFNVFADAGYVNNVFPHPTNNMVNSWQFSTGVGLDFVTYYDQVFRIDYAFNRYGEHGLFFHIETPFYRW